MGYDKKLHAYLVRERDLAGLRGDTEGARVMQEKIDNLLSRKKGKALPGQGALFPEQAPPSTKDYVKPLQTKLF